MTAPKANAIVKNIAPKKQGVAKGLVELSAQPKVQVWALAQLKYSRTKLYQAKIVPARRTIN